MSTTKSRGSVDLSDEQREALETLLYSKEPVQRMGGYAGTGKTTLIQHLRCRLPNYAVCAYTGKAAHMLRRKGVENASTIHSLIYKPVKNEGSNEVEWLRLPEMPWDGIIVDEASMVSRQLFDDLQAFGIPLIFVGDHGQLPPVEKSREAVSLMVDPDVTLETVHRNAGEIAYFAEWVRKGNPPTEWQTQPRYSGSKVRFIDKDDALYTDYDQIICAFNRTRIRFNTLIREELGKPVDRPARGDRIMCLQNSRAAGLFNGMQGTVLNVYRSGKLKFGTEDGKTTKVIYIPEAFNSERKPEYDRYGRLPFDYCWAVTCHKAQGDEWDRVAVIEERCGAWEHTRWAYTAASRAKLQLDWINSLK